MSSGSDGSCLLRASCCSKETGGSSGRKARFERGAEGQEDEEALQAHPLNRAQNAAGAFFNPEDLAVAHVQDAVGDLRRFGVMRDHEHGLIQLAAGGVQHGKNRVGVLGIEVAGGLVGQHDSRARDQGAGDGDALLLAAGELVGAMVEAAFDLQQASEFVEKFLVEGLAGGGDLVGQLDVGLCRDRGSKLKRWKTKPIWERRRLVRCGSESREKSLPWISSEPEVAEVRPPRI